MRLRKSLKPDLLKAIALAQKEHIDVDIAGLEVQELAGGSALNCVNAYYLYAQKNQVQVSYKQLSAIDLTNKDLIACIDRCKNPLSLVIEDTDVLDLKNKSLSYHLTGNFKMDFYKASLTPDNHSNLIEEIKIKSTISSNILIAQIE